MSVKFFFYPTSGQELLDLVAEKDDVPDTEAEHMLAKKGIRKHEYAIWQFAPKALEDLMVELRIWEKSDSEIFYGTDPRLVIQLLAHAIALGWNAHASDLENTTGTEQRKLRLSDVQYHPLKFVDDASEPELRMMLVNAINKKVGQIVTFTTMVEPFFAGIRRGWFAFRTSPRTRRSRT